MPINALRSQDAVWIISYPIAMELTTTSTRMSHLMEYHPSSLKLPFPCLEGESDSLPPFPFNGPFILIQLPKTFMASH